MGVRSVPRQASRERGADTPRPEDEHSLRYGMHSVGSVLPSYGVRII